MLINPKNLFITTALTLLLVLAPQLWAAEVTIDKVEQARESGYWEVGENETLLGIAQLLLPDQPHLYTDFVRDVTGLNFEIFGAVERNQFRQGVSIKLPDYVLTEAALARRRAAAQAKQEKSSARQTEIKRPAKKASVKSTTQQIKKQPVQSLDRVKQARKSGRIVIRPGDNMFKLARLFFPQRAHAQQLFIQEVIKLNPEVFKTATINAIPAGAVLKLPGYVWDQATVTPSGGEGKLRLPELVGPREVMEEAEPDEVASEVSREESLVEGDKAIVIEPKQPGGTAKPEEARVTASYTDQYLSDDPGYVDQEEIEQASQKPGRRVLDVASHYYRNDDDFLGDEVEAGVNIHWRRETLNYGEIDVDMSVSDFDRNRLNQTNDGTDLLLTVRQTDMPLSSIWRLNTTLGHQRSIPSPFLQGGYRFRLPTSPLLGLSGEARSQFEEVHWFLGNTGAYQGVALRQFEEDDGKLLGLSYERQLTPGWRLGGKLVNLQDHPEVSDHSSVLLGGRYQPEDFRSAHELHLLADDDNNLGIWSDSSNDLNNGFALRYGAYYIEPDLAWTDASVANDQFGLYSRLDKRGFRHDFSIGYDYFETGLEDALTESDNHSIYFNNNYRINKSLTFGLSSNIAQREFMAAENDKQNSWRLQGFIYQRMALGTSRYELFASELDSDNESNRRENQGVRWSHDWRTPRRYRLTTELSAENDKQFSDEQRQWLLGTIFRHDVNDDFSWNINAAFIRRDSDNTGSSDDVSLNASTRWQFRPNWYAALSVNYNQTTTDIDVTDFITNDEEITTDGIWLTLGYSRATGRAYPNFGVGSNRAGAGKIYGTVFYDDNRDGIRQPGERAAGGVILMLDGRYEARTDNQGRFSYEPVPSGQHYVRLVVEDLPLPWGLDDESPRMVNVGVRQNEELNFPLIRTDQ